MAKSNIPEFQLRDCTTGCEETGVTYGFIKKDGISSAIKPIDAPAPPVSPQKDDEAGEPVVNLK